MTDTKSNYRRLSGIELPCTLREGLSLDIRRLSWIINSQVSEQEERISKSSKFPSLWDLVLYIYSSVEIVDAVLRRMWVKPRAIYTPEYQNTWESLL